MDLRELFDIVLVNSSQFFLPTHKVEVDLGRFAKLVNLSLGFYNRYHMITDNAYFESHLRQIKFLDTDFNGYGKPCRVYDIKPSTHAGITINPIATYAPANPFNKASKNPYLEEKCQFPYDYNKGVLTLPYDSTFQVFGVFEHKIRAEEVDGKTEFFVDTISPQDDAFIELLTGKFIQVVAGVRNAFTLAPMEISSSADTMKLEGKEKEDAAKEDIRTNKMKMYVAWQV